MASHWTFDHFEKEIVRLVTFTNCQQVELFVNNQSMGIKTLSDYPNYMTTWYVPYEKVTVKAVGMNNGLEVCYHEFKTAGKAYMFCSIINLEYKHYELLNTFL